MSGCEHWSCKRVETEVFGTEVETNPERTEPLVASLRRERERVEGMVGGCVTTVEFEREWIARAIGQKQSVATECSTRTKEHRGGPRDKRLIFVFFCGI